MKTCPRCNTTTSEFSKNKRKKDGLQTYCKPCYKEINADTYLRLEKRRSKIRATNKATVARNKAFIDRVRRMFGCKICGENEPVALDFHHTDPSQKDTEVPKLLGYGRKKLLAEIRKCVVLCSNCHRKHHAGIEGFKL